MKVLFVAGFGPIVHDANASQRFYIDSLGIEMETDDGAYFHTGGVDGVKHFALWPLTAAAQSCFGTDVWPEDVPAPQAWIEFDVDDIDVATAELIERGYKLLVGAKTEPWGQVVTRLLGPEGTLVGVTHTPWMRNDSGT